MSEATDGTESHLALSFSGLNSPWSLSADCLLHPHVSMLLADCSIRHVCSAADEERGRQLSPATSVRDISPECPEISRSGRKDSRQGVDYQGMAAGARAMSLLPAGSDGTSSAPPTPQRLRSDVLTSGQVRNPLVAVTLPCPEVTATAAPPAVCLCAQDSRPQATISRVMASAAPSLSPPPLTADRQCDPDELERPQSLFALHAQPLDVEPPPLSPTSGKLGTYANNSKRGASRPGSQSPVGMGSPKVLPPAACLLPSCTSAQQIQLLGKVSDEHPCVPLSCCPNHTSFTFY